jgi:hypothetical protein
MTETTEATSLPVPELVNPLLEKLKRKIPGESFRLPSRGLFYTNGELDPEVEDGQVVVYPMTTVDELKMRNADMLFQGSAITEVIGHCVPQILKPNALIAPDIDYLLTCIRKVSYGPLLPIEHKCKKCGFEKEYNISIDYFIQKTKEITQKQYDQMNIMINDFKVRIKPCVFTEMIKILQSSSETLDTVEKLSDWLDSSLVSIIKSVDNVKDRDQILAWLKKLPRHIKEELSNAIETQNQWGLEFSYEIKCEAEGCGEKADIKSTLNPTGFFMLPSSPKTETK